METRGLLSSLSSGSKVGAGNRLGARQIVDASGRLECELSECNPPDHILGCSDYLNRPSSSA